MAIIARKKQLTYRDSTLGPDGPELQGGGPDVVVVVHGLLRSPGTGSRVVRLPATICKQTAIIQRPCTKDWPVNYVL